MEMQTGSTNNHLSQIFFVFAAPVNSIAGIGPQSETDIYHLPPSRPPLFLTGHSLSPKSVTVEDFFHFTKLQLKTTC
jgi:hypothetical protein